METDKDDPPPFLEKEGTNRLLELKDKYGEVSGYILFSQLTRTDEKEATEFAEIEATAIVATLARAASELQGMPLMPTNGWGAGGKKGPWMAYYSYADARYFAESYDKLKVQTTSGEERELRVQAQRADIEGITRNSKRAEASLLADCCFMNIHMKPGFDFVHVSKLDIQTILRERYQLAIMSTITRPLFKK